MKKVCQLCDQEKDEREFHMSRTTGHLDVVCKSCKREMLHAIPTPRPNNRNRPVVELWD